MAIIPEGTKFLGLDPTYDTVERRSSLVNSKSEYFTLDAYPYQDENSPNDVNKIWAGTQAQYDALGSYDSATLYYII